MYAQITATTHIMAHFQIFLKFLWFDICPNFQDIIMLLLYNQSYQPLIKQQYIMKKSRPYGISYEGKLSKRLTSRMNRLTENKAINQQQQSKNQVSKACDIIDQRQEQNCLNQKQRKSVSQLQDSPVQSVSNPANKFNITKDNVCKKQHEQIQKQLQYVEKFLTLEQKNNNLSFKKSKRFNKQAISLNLSKAKKYLCDCGRSFSVKNNLFLHMKIKHKIQSLPNEQINDKKLQISKEKVRCISNWQSRIAAAFNFLKFDSQQVQYLYKNETVQLNVNFVSDFALKELYLSCNLINNRLAIILFMNEMNIFLKADCNKELYKIWLLQFSSMSLIGNFFHQWQTSIKSIHINNLIEEIKEKLNSQQGCKFYLTMFEIFNNWCYFNEYCSSLLKLNVKFKTIEEM